MKTILALLIIMTILQSSSCNKKDPLGPQIINNSLIFVLKKNNNRLPDSILNNIKMYYYTNGQKIRMSDLERGIDEGTFLANSLGILATRNIGATSGDDNIKSYYLEYPNGTQDTLFVDYRHVSYNEAVNNNCYCYYPLIEVRYNGQVAPIDTSISAQKVYLFKK